MDFLRSVHNLKKSSSYFWRLLSKSADLSNPWGRFFRILCISQKVRTLLICLVEKLIVWWFFWKMGPSGLSYIKLTIFLLLQDQKGYWEGGRLQPNQHKLQDYEAARSCAQPKSTFWDLVNFRSNIVEAVQKILLRQKKLLTSSCLKSFRRCCQAIAFKILSLHSGRFLSYELFLIDHEQ